jgi:hypothetical protein
MKSQVSIYLAGNIKKGHEKVEDTYWTDEDIHVIKNRLSDFDVSILNPAFRSDDLTDLYAVFGRDMLQVKCSDIVFVDARGRRGLGVGAEMMFAKVHQIPLVIWAPHNSHYRRSKTTLIDVPIENYVHPFILSLADTLADTLEEGIEWIHSYLSNNALYEIKGMEHISQAINHYKERQLGKDEPMLSLLESNIELKRKVEDFVEVAN